MSSPVIAVGAVVVKDGSLLMVRRAQEPSAGLWSVPGGRVEHGEYLSDALQREVREETGLEIEVLQLLGILEVVGDPHYVILDYVATTSSEGEPVAGTDVSEVRWVPLDDIGALECTPRFEEMLRAWGVLEEEGSGP
ncbi:MAG TPA: NUDIX hydrolase [Actinomycetota bacterium]|nr:NUDIX hydrolase [Actinomycetota bacterium]